MKKIFFYFFVFVLGLGAQTIRYRNQATVSVPMAATAAEAAKIRDKALERLRKVTRENVPSRWMWEFQNDYFWAFQEWVQLLREEATHRHPGKLVNNPELTPEIPAEVDALRAIISARAAEEWRLEQELQKYLKDLLNELRRNRSNSPTASPGATPPKNKTAPELKSRGGRYFGDINPTRKRKVRQPGRRQCTWDTYSDRSLRVSGRCRIPYFPRRK